MADDLTLPSDMPQASAPAPDPSANLVLPSDLAEQQAAANQPSVAGDIAQGAGSGIVKGAAALAGTAGDVQNSWNKIWDHAALGVMHKGFDWTGYGPQAGTPERAEFDQDWNDLNDVGTAVSGPQNLPTTQNVVQGIEAVGGKLYDPKTMPGKYAETIGEFLPAAATGPESALKKLAYGAVIPGAASETAGQLTQGTSLEPAARIAGAFGGVGLSKAAEEGVNIAGRAAGKIGDAIQPMTTSGQDAMAAQRLNDAASDPAAVKSALATPAADLVAGSKPTTFQLTGDMGLGSAEKVAETQDPVPFQQRRADQNQARVSAMTGLQPGGAPEDLAAGLRAQLSRLDDMESGNVNTATLQAQDAAAGLGGFQSPEFYGRQIQGAVQPQIDAAQQELSQAFDRLGGTGTPEQYGAQMREPLQDAKDVARAQRSALYRAIDPDGTLNTVVTGPRQAADDLMSNLSPMAKQPTGDEADLIAKMRGMPDVMPFGHLIDLDKELTAARMAEYKAAGESPSWGRLGQLKDAVQSGIANATANQIAYERQATAAGHMVPENTFEARLQQEINAWRATRAEAAGFNGGAGASADPAGRTRTFSGNSGAEGQGNFRSGNAPSDQGIPSAPLQPNFDEAAADRLNIAKQTHAQFAQTFKEGPAANILKTNGFAGQYRLVDSGVPNQVFQPGPKGGDTLRSYLRAVGDREQGMQAVRNYAAMSLRRAAQRPDGTLNFNRYHRWIEDHIDALRAIPGGGMRDLTTVQRAQEALDRFLPFAEAHGPSAIPEMFFHSGAGGGEAVNNLRNLVGDRVAGTSLTDYAASKLRSTALKPDGTLDPRKVETFTRTHQAALDALPGLADRFSSAARATETINDAAAARKQALDAYQRDAVGKVIGSTEPSDITRMVGDVFSKNTAVAQMRDLASKARAAGPDAFQGLRKAIADNIATRFMSNSEAATSGTNKISANAFQTFVKKNASVLGQVFRPEEVQSLQAIADDITRANRSRDAINVPGQSATRQLHGMVRHAEGPEHGSWLEAMFKGSFAAREIGEMLENVPIVGHALEHFAPPLAMGTAVMKHVVGSMQAAGLKRVDELYRDALLNPELAKSLLEKVKPAASGKTPGASLTTQIMRLAPFYGTQTVPDAPQPARADGGRVEPTDAQKEAGNYKKDHVTFAGLDLSIENRKGEERSGIGKDGKRWSVKMPAAYGYIKGTVGADGDHIDCYVGPDEKAPYAWVINQMDLQPRRFDEHKIMLGYRDRDEALATYERGFSDGKGKQRIGRVTAVPIGALPKWLEANRGRDTSRSKAA